MQEGERVPRPSLMAEIAGWYGIAAILGAYALSSFDLLERGPAYQVLNLTGAIGVGWVCWRKRTWQAFWLEAVWGGVAAISLISMAFGP